MLPDWGEMRCIGRKAVGIGDEPGRKGSDAKNEAGGRRGLIWVYGPDYWRIKNVN